MVNFRQTQVNTIFYPKVYFFFLQAAGKKMQCVKIVLQAAARKIQYVKSMLQSSAKKIHHVATSTILHKKKRDE